MKTALIILCVILSPAILYLAAVAVGFLDMRLTGLIRHFYKISDAERQYDENAKRTKYSLRKRVSRYIFLGIFVAIFGTLSIVAFATEDAIIGAMMTALGSLLTALPLSLCLQAWLSYEVIKEDGIDVHRIFFKKFIAYSDMTCYTSERGVYDALSDVTVYGADNKRLIWISGRLGTNAIISTLNSHGIIQKEKTDIDQKKE